MVARGDARYPSAAFYAYAHPAPDGFDAATLTPVAARWEEHWIGTMPAPALAGTQPPSTRKDPDEARKQH